MQQIWKCNGDDTRTMPSQLWKKDLSILLNPEKMTEALLTWRMIENRKEIILPLVQNLEGAALGADIIKRENYWTTGNYPFHNLKEILEKINTDQFNIIKDKRIQAVIEVVKRLKENPLILEVEAPFSVLASLINPMELYAAMVTEPKLLEKILKKIVLEETKYIKEVIQAGCRIISLAEPAGTIDMVGEKYFKECSGKAIEFLLKECEKFLQKSVIHLCGKLSSSMIAVQMVKEKEYPVKSKDYLDNILEVTGNSEIHFVGQRCIHQRKNNTGKIYLLNLN